MQAQGNLTADRGEWLQDVEEHLAMKFKDPLNDAEAQTNRLEYWRLQSWAYLNEHGFKCLPSLAGWFQSLASSPHLSGPGADGIPAEVWQRAPWPLKVALYQAL
eukprot:11224988-Lingulodinium_polyedra.AAC.1